MRTTNWILPGVLLVLSIGCQRAEKTTAEKSPASEGAPVAEVAQETTPATESVQAIPADNEAVPQTAAAPAAGTPRTGKPTTGTPTTAAKTAAAEVEPAAQPTTAKTEATAATTNKPTTTEPKAAESSSGEASMTKAEIINSLQFRRAIFEFNEWLTSQPIYTPQQVAQIKNQFNHRVAEMNAQELTYLLNDLEAKMQLINTPEAREARAWMGQYLSVMSDRKRAEVLKDVPNVATMTAAQLADELSRIQEKRATMDNEQAAFQKGQAAQVAQQVQTDRIAQQNFVRDWNTGPVAYSPYSSNSNVNERLNNAPIGTGMTFYTGGWGGVGVAFSPSAW